MPVNTPSAEYNASLKQWTTCRDAYDGSDAIKKKGVEYLPALDSQNTQQATTGSSAKYDAYKTRALFYNATYVDLTNEALNVKNTLEAGGDVVNTFTDISAGLPGVRSSSVAWGDYDNDGDIGLVLPGGSIWCI